MRISTDKESREKDKEARDKIADQSGNELFCGSRSRLRKNILPCGKNGQPYKKRQSKDRKYCCC